jgi:hypothetical protein
VDAWAAESPALIGVRVTLVAHAKTSRRAIRGDDHDIAATPQGHGRLAATQRSDQIAPPTTLHAQRQLRADLATGALRHKLRADVTTRAQRDVASCSDGVFGLFAKLGIKLSVAADTRDREATRRLPGVEISAYRSDARHTADVRQVGVATNGVDLEVAGDALGRQLTADDLDANLRHLLKVGVAADDIRLGATGAALDIQVAAGAYRSRALLDVQIAADASIEEDRPAVLDRDIAADRPIYGEFGDIARL